MGNNRGMEATPVNVRRVTSVENDLDADLARVEVVAKLMDSQFEIAGIKFGADALIGLIPVAGDAISFGIGLYPILIARKHGLGRVVIGRMMMNLGIDFVVGLVPVVGDVADVVHKANLKNVEVLRKAVAKRTSLRDQ